MKFYIHPINPHISAEHHDTYLEGWHYGIWEYDYPAIAPHLYRFQSQHMEAALDTQKKAQDASRDFADMPETNKYEFHDAHPFSAQAAIILAKASQRG